MASITDIAKAAGVSHVTVSRILNGDVQYHRPTFAKRASKIRKMAVEMGYRPNASAQAVRRGTFDAVALLLSADRTWSMLPDQLLAGIREGLTKRGLHLLVEAMSDDVLTSEAVVPKLLRQLTCDGLLINYNSNIPPDMVRLIDSYKLPCIWINSKQPHDAVHPDDYGAGAWAARLLLERGHPRIAFVDFANEDQPGHYSALDRYAGYADTVAGAGLVARRIGHPRFWGRGEMIDCLRAALREASRPTALIGYSDLDARAIQMAAALEGLRLGRDLSVITFFDRELNDLGQKITTLLLPQHEAGRESVRMLLEKIADPSRELPSIALPFGLTPGSTLEPAPDAGAG